MHEPSNIATTHYHPAMSRTIHTLPIDKRSHQHYHHNATVVLATPSAKSATRSSAQRERQPLPGL